MKTEELIELLKRYPGYDVLKSSDDEGNSFQIVDGYDDSCRHDGEYHTEVMTDPDHENAAECYPEDLAPKEWAKCIILF